MMGNIKYYLIIFIFIISSCTKNEKRFWLPVAGKEYLNVEEMQKDTLKLNFVNYYGFVLSLDELYLKNGFVKQDLDLNDVITDSSLVNSYKNENIEKIIFAGVNLDLIQFEEMYNLKLKFKENEYEVYNNNGMCIGYLTINKKDNTFQLVLIPI